MDFSRHLSFAGSSQPSVGKAIEVHTSEVHRNLDAKFKIGGLEAFDLLLALIFGAVMNLFFGGTSLELPLVIGAPILILVTLYFGKKGKPENFLIDFLRFYMEPGFYSAGEEHKHQKSMRGKIYE